MVKYDPNVIREFADALYQRAATIVLVNAAIFGVVGAAAGYALKGSSTAVIGLVVGGGIGYYLGLQKTFLLKLQAQTALCQVEIEANTGSRSTCAESTEGSDPPLSRISVANSQTSTAKVSDEFDGAIDDQKLMAQYGITFDGERYTYGDNRYDKLNDAVNYAKLQ